MVGTPSSDGAPLKAKTQALKIAVPFVAWAVPLPIAAEPHRAIAWAMSIGPTMSSRLQDGTARGANLKSSSKSNWTRSVRVSSVTAVRRWMLIPPAWNRCVGAVLGVNLKLTVEVPVAIATPAMTKVEAAAVIAARTTLDGRPRIFPPNIARATPLPAPVLLAVPRTWLLGCARAADRCSG
jgi:hypothetical protein